MNNIISDIERGVSTLLVQNTDEFLRTFNSLTYVNTNLIDRILFLVRSGGLIAINRGGMGEIYQFGPNNVLKRTKNCLPPPERMNYLVKKLCKYAQDGSPIYIIKNTLYNKDIILCPNYFSEAIVNSILQRLQPFTPSFISMNGALYDNRDTVEYPMYIISELLDNFNWMNTETLSYYLFQLFFGLYIAQKTLRYTHYDFHAGNVMLRRKNVAQIQKYDLGNGIYVYSRHSFDAIIIDYGFSRCESPEHIICPSGNVPELKSNFYEFNEYIDVASLLHYLILQLDRLDANPDIINDPDYRGIRMDRVACRPIIENIMAAYYRVSVADLNVVRNYYYAGGTYWRATPSKLYQRLPLTLQELMTYMVVNNMLHLDITSSISTYNQLIDIFNSNTNNSAFISTVNNIINNNIQVYGLSPELYIQDITHNQTGTVEAEDVPYTTNNGIYYNVELLNVIGNGINFRMNYENFNRTRGPSPDLSNQYISIARLLQPSEDSENPFRFRSDCCRIDPKLYFQNNIFEEGIAINASFFNIFSNYESVGLYKSGEYITDNPIPEGYEDMYASIVIREDNNNLDIVSVNDARMNIDNYNVIITAGPLLINNGNRLITDDILAANPTRNADGTVTPNPFNC
jgi:hypothetical protein